MFVHYFAVDMPRPPAATAFQAAQVVSSLLQRLASVLCLEEANNRIRCLDLIVMLLRGIPKEVELDEESAKATVAQLQERLADKDATVRQKAVVALSKLVAFQEGVPVSENVTFKAMLNLLECETNKEVRAAIVSRLPLDASSLPLLLARGCGDDTALVAQQLYVRLCRDLALTEEAAAAAVAAEGQQQQEQQQAVRVAASPQQRRELLWGGLQESRPEVLKAAQELLGKWFTEDAAGDVERLVAALGPQESPELCDLVLGQLAQLQHWEPQAWLQAAADSTQPGASPRALAAAPSPAAAPAGAFAGLAAVTPARAYVWLYACRQVDARVRASGQAAATRLAATAAQAEASAGAQAEAVLDAFLPSAADMAQLCLRAAQAGPAHRYVAAALLRLAALPAFNWVDAASRAMAVEVLGQLVASPALSMMPEQGAANSSSAATTASGRLPPLGCGGGGQWEDAVLALAAAVLGGGDVLVEGCLPLVMRLAEQLGVSEQTAGTAPEGAMLQALGYLRLLMARAGPSVSPAASAQLPPSAAAADAAGGSIDQGDADDEQGEPADALRISLEQAVQQLAGNAGGHGSPAVRAAAVRCHVVLALREGGLERVLPAALAAMLPLLPLPGAASAASGTPSSRKEAEWQQLPRRAAVQGLVDLALLWGEPAVTAALRRAVAVAAAVAGATAAQVEAVTSRMAAVGVMEVDGEGDQGDAGAGAAAEQEGAGAAAGAQAVPPPQAAVGVVPLLLQLTEGLVRKLQGYDDYAEATGPAADALLGCARLAAQWGSQRRLAAYSRQHPTARGAAFSAMAPELAELLVCRLHLARVSPALEQQPQLLAAVHMALGNVRELASQPNAGGAAYRQLLATAFLPAARCAMALPPPPGAAATAKCAAPELMDSMARELAAATAAAAAATAAQLADEAEDAEDDDEEDEDVASRPDGGLRSQQQRSQRQQRLAEVAAAAAQLGKMLLEELALVAIERDEAAAGAGAGSEGANGSSQADAGRRRRSPLDTHGDKAAQAYTEELCKAPALLLPEPVLAAAGGDDLAALGFLGRRAVRFAESELRPDKVVTEAALRKLKDLVEDVENTRQERAGSAALTEEDAAPLLEALLARLAVLPSQEQVAAEVAADEQWDVLTTSAAGGDNDQLAQQPAGSSRRSGGGSGSRATKSSSTAATGRAARGTRAKAATAAVGGRARRNDLRPVREEDEGEEDEDEEGGGDAASVGDSSDDDMDAGETDVVRKRGKAAGLSKARGAAKPSSSQTSAAPAAAPAGERRSSRAAAAKAAEKMQMLKEKDKVAARLVRLSQGETH
ncbi:hypothetical protein HYH02_011748 [Chlamydomonas schloesseri]|uniref:Nuclear condensin complex subunit 3 C-terminal domain-containing protein n=1 Tax=Chlamydomonas schloesseri TaxID=2026947 RepID=A0A835T2A4_9CHLO|nr:hypothetical protein HYH02_011748 [Chlamydomonas schloesseri]|eukprot:KAG2436036.1 hypothetical protein HYH02_011748 [Chlamydomonas schloesseri]